MPSTADDRLSNVIYHATPKAVNLDSIKAETKRDNAAKSAVCATERRLATGR